jgi:ribonuclease HI
VRRVELWADGSGTTRGNQGGWCAILVDVETGREREIVGAAVDATNNTMELRAVTRGLQALAWPCEVTIHTDSEYVVKAFTHAWIDAWERRRWNKVANIDYWRELLAAAAPHRCRWVHVKGHSGVAYNERCDRAAVAARKALTEAISSGTVAELEFEVDGDASEQLELM